MKVELFSKKLLKSVTTMTVVFALGGQIPSLSLVNVHAEEVGVQNSQSSQMKNVEQKREKATQTVANFTQLKNYLEGNNGITNLIVTADITMTSGIQINKNKAAVTIDFQGHKLTEMDSNSLYDTIHISSNTGTKEVTLKNTTIDGKNYMGTIGVAEIAKNVTLNFENITYTGPQFIRNTGGTATFFGDNSFLVKNVGSKSPVNSFAQMNKLEIAGNFDLKHVSNTAATFVFPGAKPTMTINNDANVIIASDEAEVFDNNDDYIDFVLKNGGEIQFDSAGELSKNKGFGEVNLQDNSIFTMNRKNVIHPGEPSMEIYKSLTATKGSSLRIDHSKGVTADVIRAYDDVTVTFDSMKELALKGQLGSLATNFGANGVLNLTTSNIAGWETSITETPDFSVNKDIKASFNMSGGSIESVIESNIPNITNELTYNDPYKLVIGEGIEIEVPDPSFNVVYDRDTIITGLGEPGATIIATIDGVEIGRGVVGSDGRWSIPITPQEAGTVIDIVQEIDGNKSNTVSQIVQHLDSDTVNYFKLGYWQDYGLVLEGSIDDADWDLTDSSKVHKQISLVNNAGEVALTVDAVNIDWYNPGVFNGYQVIIVNEDLASLPVGYYKLTVSISVDGGETITQDLNVNNKNLRSMDDQTPIFDEIGTQIVGGSTKATPINIDGIGYIEIS